MKTQNAIFGRSRKSFGSATAYTMNGQNIVRTKPIAVANPRTDAQTAQRVRFRAFTETANSLPEDELLALIPEKELGRNRRTTLQAQLAPAYGAQANSDPTAAERIVSTFNYTKLGDIGTGEVGYVGDLGVLAGVDETQIAIDKSEMTPMLANVVNTEDSDEMAIVVISEDGCVMGVHDMNKTFAQLKAQGVSESIIISTSRYSGHGSTVKAWVVKKKERLQLIGLGTFSVAKRNARDRHNAVQS